MKEIRTIGVIGAGKLATHLSLTLHRGGFNIEWVWSRTERSAKALSSSVKATSFSDPKTIFPAVDLVLVCVPDLAVVELARKLDLKKFVAVHASGTLPQNALKEATLATGVFYPLQSFTLGREIPIKDIPICIESESQELETMLVKLAERISGRVVKTLEGQRLCLHIAAVFANNFSNYMFSVAEKLLQQSKLDPSLLHPLMRETAEKAISMSPVRAQTGPAIRGDENTINKHLEWLDAFPEHQAVYRLMTDQLKNNKK